MGWTIKGPEFESRWGQEFSLFDVAHTGSGAHPASYPKGTGGSFPGGKATGVWSCSHLPLVPRSRKHRSIHSLSLRLHGVVINYELSTRVTLPFYFLTDKCYSVYAWSKNYDCITTAGHTSRVTDGTIRDGNLECIPQCGLRMQPKEVSRGKLRH
jgi:hypothetical protein